MAYSTDNPVKKIAQMGASNALWYYTDGDAIGRIDDDNYFIDDLAIDRFAKEDEEYRLEQKEGMLKNNIIPIRRKKDVGTSNDNI